MTHSNDGLPRALPRMPAALERIGYTYGNALRMRGPKAAGVGWSSETGQFLRFRILLRLLEEEPPGAGVTVHDLGCGYGALWPVLAGLEQPRITAYTGYDISRPMIETARNLHGRDPRARFLLGAEPGEDADYGFVSGTFNYRDGETDEAWRAYVFDSLATFAGCCRKGMAFNMLHRRTLKKIKRMYYADPDVFLAFAKRLAAARRGRVALLDDYLNDDFTIFIQFRT